MAKPIVVTVGVDNNFATLLFAMATSLKKLENEVQIHRMHVERFHFHMVKILRKLVKYIWRYSIKCASFFGRVVLTFTNKPCQL